MSRLRDRLIEKKSKPLATVEPIHDRVEWSARAAAGDALSRVPESSPFVAMWLEGDEVKWSMANVNAERMAILSAVLQEFLNARIRDLMTR